MDMVLPFVTVLIPAFNAAATIRRAIDSALAQTYHNFEVIVVDDGSRDATAEIVATYDSDRIRLLRLTHNQGECAAMNEGIAAARGDFIAFLDADDEWLSANLATQVRALQCNPNAVMAVCGCRFVGQQGILIRVESDVPSYAQNRAEVWRSLLAETLIAKPCVLTRAEALRAVGPFDTRLAVAGDQDMWIRLAMRGEVEFVEDVLTIVHETAGSLTKAYARQSDRYLLPMVLRHVEQQRYRLSDREVRHILGVRFATTGRNLYASGSLLRGATLILRAMLLGHGGLDGLWYLVTASPPAQMAKRLLRYSGRKDSGNVDQSRSTRSTVMHSTGWKKR